ncbi:MAG: beta-glucosidase BglX [Ekhidna sp.]|nr:beta-glucosidase BglX [Ekhidna sp.]
MRKLLLITLILVSSVVLGQEYPYQNSELSIEERVDNLLSIMTLEEKVGQLVQVNFSKVLTGPPADDSDAFIRENIKKGKIGSVLNLVSAEQTYEAQKLVQEHTRLKIPLLMGLDVIHGHQTMFPVPIGLTASWDTGAMMLSAQVAAREAASQGVHWTFSPMVDISRDARWGRIMESGGEDPYLSSQVAAALVKGYQGDLSEVTTIAACAKHFAGYGFAEGGRDYNTTEISLNTLHNVVLPPFKAAVEAGVATIMNGYNDMNGRPVTANSYLQQDVLKDQWGFDGFVVSDWNSIGELMIHGFAEDKKHASSIAMNAGNDMDMMTYGYFNHLEELVKEGQVSEARLDESVRRVLRVKFRLGLFEDPYAYSNKKREKQELGSKENLAATKEVAKKTFVLLKNDSKLLPIKKELKNVALIGPLADHKDVALGNWRAKAITNSAVSIKEGLSGLLPKSTELRYAEGCALSTGNRGFLDQFEMNESDTTGFNEAIELAKNSELVVLALGEDCYQTGEGRSKVSIQIPEVQIELLEELVKVNSNVAVVLMGGRPLDITRIEALAPTILMTWLGGSEAGNAIAEVLIGEYNPSGKLPVSFPRSVGQEPLYYNRKSTGRPTGPDNKVNWSRYIDSPHDALYPFGFGLSYSDFEYADLELSSDKMKRGEEIEVKVNLVNTGSYDGEEVVQLYIRDHVSSMTRHVKELKGFQKVMVKAGETKGIVFKLSEKDLEFFSANQKWEAEPGKFSVMVGGNSRDLQELAFTLED